MPTEPSHLTPGAAARRGSTSYDHTNREYVTDHSSKANPPLRPFAPRGGTR